MTDARLWRESRKYIKHLDEHYIVQSRRLYDFLYAFTDWGHEPTPEHRAALEAAYNAIFPKCKAHERGEDCDCPWTDVGWVVNEIAI